MQMFRGEIWYAQLPTSGGSVQEGERPVIIIQNNVGNKHSPTVIVAAISSSDKRKENDLPTHVPISRKESRLEYDSVIMLEQIRTISKTCMKRKVALASTRIMKEVNQAIRISCGLHTEKEEQ